MAPGLVPHARESAHTHLTTTGAGSVVGRALVGVVVTLDEVELGMPGAAEELCRRSSSLGSKTRASGMSACSPSVGGLAPAAATNSPSGPNTHRLPWRPPVPAFSHTNCAGGYGLGLAKAEG